MPIPKFRSTSLREANCKAFDLIKCIPSNFTVVFTGGEPLLRKDLEFCGRELRKQGFRWSVVSNAYLYDKPRHISLLNAGMGALTLSLDGLKESCINIGSILIDGSISACPNIDRTFTQGNGFHNWHGEMKQVLVCHNEKIERATKHRYLAPEGQLPNG